MAARSPTQSALQRESEPGRPNPSGAAPLRAARINDKTDYQHRHFVNLAAAAALLIIAVAIIWTVRAIEEQQRVQRCLDSGRRNCVDLNVSARHGVRNLGRNITPGIAGASP